MPEQGHEQQPRGRENPITMGMASEKFEKLQINTQAFIRRLAKRYDAILDALGVENAKELQTLELAPEEFAEKYALLQESMVLVRKFIDAFREDRPLAEHVEFEVPENEDCQLMELRALKKGGFWAVYHHAQGDYVMKKYTGDFQTDKNSVDYRFVNHPTFYRAPDGTLALVGDEDEEGLQTIFHEHYGYVDGSLKVLQVLSDEADLLFYVDRFSERSVITQAGMYKIEASFYVDDVAIAPDGRLEALAHTDTDTYWLVGNGQERIGPGRAWDKSYFFDTNKGRGMTAPMGSHTIGLYEAPGDPYFEIEEHEHVQFVFHGKLGRTIVISSTEDGSNACKLVVQKLFNETSIAYSHEEREIVEWLLGEEDGLMIVSDGLEY
jgi:hypothetical protein